MSKSIYMKTNYITNELFNEHWPTRSIFSIQNIKIIHRLKIFILASLFLFIEKSVSSQIIVADPVFPTVDDSVTIIFDATQGNKGLMNFTGDVYAHTGVITNLSTSPSDWKHAPTWGDNSLKYKLTRIGTNLYQLKITPSIRAYYGILNNEVVKQLAFVFRSADKTKEGKTETNGDIFYSVINDTLIHVQRAFPSTSVIIAEVGNRIPLLINANKVDSFQMFVNQTYIRSYYSSTKIIDTIDVVQKGKYWVVVKAFKGNEVVADSFYYFVPNETRIESIPEGYKDGINYLNDSTVALVLVAPNKTNAYVIGEFNNWELDTIYQMRQTPDKTRFWIVISHLLPGKEYAYQFFVDNLKIADPYCQKILDPWNDKYITSITYPQLKPYPEGKTTGIVSILQTAQPAYQWKYNASQIPPKEKLIIYELLVRDFHSSHSYQAIIDSLSYLKSLGINAIELMPVMEFEGNESWGYNPAFYFAPDKYYGPANLLKKLIDTCHSMGIAVILDIVLNHSFGQSPMVQLYWDAVNNRPSADNPWYNPTPKHDFNVGYDFNHESAYTKLFVSQVLKFWLTEYRVDGYRFDLSKGFTQKNTLGNVSAWGQYDSTRVMILKTYADTIWKINSNATIILEHFADNQEEKILASYGFLLWGNANYNYREASMGWNDGSKSDFSWGSYKIRGFSNPALVTYMESHDEERMVYSNLTYGNNTNALYTIKGNLPNALKRAELCVAFFLTIPGPKMIWQFGELGYDYSIDYNGRVGNKPIRWDYYQNPNRYRLYKVYSEFNRLRNQYEVFHTNNFILNVSKPVKTITLKHAEMDVIVVGNFDVNQQSTVVSFTKNGWWYNYFYGDSIEVTELTKTFMLNPGEYHIFTSKRLPRPDLLSAPMALNVSISGTIQTGSAITVNYEYFDLNNDAEGNTRVQWYRSTSADGMNKIKIVDANQSSYLLTELDKGYYLIAEVIPVAQTGILTEGLASYAIIGFATDANMITQTGFSIYPNPISTVLYINHNFSSNSEICVSIFDITGKTLLKQNWNTANRQIAIPFNNYASGIYFLKIINPKTKDNFIYKLVKL